MNQLEPPSDRVILRPHEPETETAFGLALPETAQDKSRYATVLAVGEGIEYPKSSLSGGPERIPMGFHWAPIPGNREGARSLYPLKEGDVVLMPAFNGTEIDWPGEGTVISILASELLAVVA